MRATLTVRCLATAALAAGAACAQAGKPPARAQCPVDQKPVTVAADTPSVRVNGAPRYFCGDSCRRRFAGWPEKYLRGSVVQCTVQPNFRGHIDLPRRVEVNNDLYYLCCEPCVRFMRDAPWDYLPDARDVVSGRTFKLGDRSPRTSFKQQIYLFESPETKAQFDADPAKYVLEFRR